jgi:lipopolysaccharide export system permease protein
MRLLSRHLLRELAAPFLFSLGALTSMLLLNQVSKRFGDLVGKGLPGDVIVEVLLLSLPFIVALTLPMAVLVAVLYGFSHLAADNEITAMRASGVSVAQMLGPVFITAVAVTVFNFLFIDQVLPRSNARLRNLTVDIGRKKPTFALREQAINEMLPTQYLLRASRIEPGTGRLRDVAIYDLTLPTTRRVIYADSGVMAFETGDRDLRVHLFNGLVHEFRAEEPGVLRMTAFDQNVVRARDVSNSLERSGFQFERGDREMSTCEMIDRAAFSRASAERSTLLREGYTRNDLRAALRLAADPEPEPGKVIFQAHCGAWRRVERFLGRYIFPESAEAQSPGVPRPALLPAGPSGQVVLTEITTVTTERDRARSEMRSANAFMVEVHKKLTISVSCLNFVIIGIALALRFPRGGMGVVLGGSILIFGVFYVCLTAGEQLADRNYLTPALAMWLPNILIGIAGLVGLRAVSQESGSTRGGDLADLRDLLLGWMLRGRRV